MTTPFTIEEFKKQTREFLIVGDEIQKGICDDEVVGYNCQAHSILRKVTTMKKLEELFEKNDWPLRVKDCNEFTNQLAVYFV